MSDAQPDLRPFDDLLPGRVLDAIESTGRLTDGRILPLNSYENRVYRIGLDDAEPVVAKFYRPGRFSDAAIGEEHAFALELVEAELPVIAPLVQQGETLHHYQGHRFALFPLTAGRAPEPGDRNQLRQLGRLFGRLHAIGARRDFRHRPHFSIKSHADQPLAALAALDWLPPHLQRNLEVLGKQVIDELAQRIAEAGKPRELRIHGDSHPGNLLARGEQLSIVDLDDCMTGPAMQDLFLHLSGDVDSMRGQLADLLEGYGEFHRFDDREISLVEPLRAMRLLHINGWIARRWHDPAVAAAFPWFGEPRHAETLITQLQEQLASLQEPPALL